MLITITGTDAQFSRVKKEKVIAVIGFFDGMHKGHIKLFHEAHKLKGKTGGEILAITFHPHPQTYVSNNHDKWKLLTPPYEKKHIIRGCGVDYYWPIPFTPQLAATSPEDFIEKYLVDLLGVKHVVCGFNFSFGHKGSGNPEMLRRLGNEIGYSVSIVSPCSVKDVIVSSTHIRECLAEGDMINTLEYLGRPYCIYGTIEPGAGRGGKLGFPTANLTLHDEKLLPRQGVYLGHARFTCGDGFKEDAVLVNIGTCPTFGLKEIGVEVHIPGFRGELYGEKMVVMLTDFVRPEIRFDRIDQLVAQITEDISKARCEKGSFTCVNLYDRIFLQNLP